MHLHLPEEDLLLGAGLRGFLGVEGLGVRWYNTLAQAGAADPEASLPGKPRKP